MRLPALTVCCACLTTPTLFAQWSTDTLSQGATEMTATSVGTKALFAGGRQGTVNAPIPVATVDVFDEATGTWSVASLSAPRYQLVSTTVGTKAFFAGGTDGSFSDVVDIYDDATGT